MRSISDDEEVDDPGGEVKSHVCFTVDHSDAVSVPVAGPGHTTTEQQERRPAQTYTWGFKFSSVCLEINVY